MKKCIRKITAVALSAVLLLGLFAMAPVSAAENQGFTLKVTSNLFPAKEMRYSDVSALEDENGDVFFTVAFKLLGVNQYLINLDIDELTWDKEVLEFKEAYNTVGTGRRKLFCILPFAYEQGLGTGMINTFDNSNPGRIVGNYTSVKPAAYAYEEDGSAVTMVRAKFKLLDKTASAATVTLNMDTLSLCDDSVVEPYTQHVPISARVIDADALGVATLSTQISPEGTQVTVKGDLDDDGNLDIADATILQMYLSDFGNLPVDFSDPQILASADFNGDGAVNVRDVTAMQRALLV
jgi:hypothetical protein